MATPASFTGSRTAEFLKSVERRCYVRGVDLPGFEGRSPKSVFEEEPAVTCVAARMGRSAPASLVEAQPNA